MTQLATWKDAKKHAQDIAETGICKSMIDKARKPKQKEHKMTKTETQIEEQDNMAKMLVSKAEYQAEAIAAATLKEINDAIKAGDDPAAKVTIAILVAKDGAEYTCEHEAKVSRNITRKTEKVCEHVNPNQLELPMEDEA